MIASRVAAPLAYLGAAFAAGDLLARPLPFVVGCWMLLTGAPLVALLAGAARAAGPLLPTAGRRWTAAAAVYAATVVTMPLLDMAGVGGFPYELCGAAAALAAALCLPGRLLGPAAATAVVAVTAGCLAVLPDPSRTSARPLPAPPLTPGAPPAGWNVRAVTDGDGGATWLYTGPEGDTLRLRVTEPGRNGLRVDRHGCPVVPDGPERCLPDGGGRESVTLPDGTPSLMLLRGGVLAAVSCDAGPLDLPLARHLLATLRPAAPSGAGRPAGASRRARAARMPPTVGKRGRDG